MYKCRCCNYLTLKEEPSGSFEICPVCYWEDDNVQSDNPNFSGGANKVSLKKARENFKEYGASEKEFISKVRKPLPEEILN